MNISTVNKKDMIKLLERYADNGSGFAREIMGQLLIEGKHMKTNQMRGLRYLKMAFDDPSYRMVNTTFLKQNIPGFYGLE